MRLQLSIDREGHDARFAVTFCVTGVASSVLLSVVGSECSCNYLVGVLSMYSQTLLSNTTLQCGRRTDDCPTDKSDLEFRYK